MTDSKEDPQLNTIYVILMIQSGIQEVYGYVHDEENARTLTKWLNENDVDNPFCRYTWSGACLLPTPKEA